MFSYIIPNVTLMLTEVRRVYEQINKMPRDQTRVCNPFATAWALWEQEEAWQALLEQQRCTVREMLQEKMRQREWEALLLVLTTTDSEPVWDAILTMLTNIETMMSRGCEEMLQHLGQVLTMRELNRLQHMLNGNIKGWQLKQLMKLHNKKPYDHPKKSIKQ